MKKVLVTLVILVAFAITSADLNFSDSKTWKVSSINGQFESRFVEKNKSNVYINAMIYDAVTSRAFAGICDGRAILGLAFDKAGNTWIATDSGVCRQSSADTTWYLAGNHNAGILSTAQTYVSAIYYDADSNRIIIGTDNGVGVATLDANYKPTVWVYALSVTVHQIVVVKGQIWAISIKNVYQFANGNWVEYTQFGVPISGDVDRAGNFWVSFQRPDSVLVYSKGLAKFDGQNWTEYFVSTDSTSFFGKIRIDKQNTLWFSGDAGLGRVDLSTMTQERILPGTYSWNPGGQTVALSITDQGAAIFAGAYAWIENISASPVIWNPVVPANRGATYQVIGTFDPLGRKIVNINVNINSFSAHSFSSGNYFTIIRSANGIKAREIRFIQ